MIKMAGKGIKFWIHTWGDGIYVLEASESTHRIGMHGGLQARGWTWARGIGCRGAWYTKDRAEAAEIGKRLGIEIQDAQPRGQLITVCAWCNRVKSNTGKWMVMGLGASDRLTHGICPRCKKRWLAEAKQNQDFSGVR